jgi:5'-3' exonuclease
MKTDSDLILLIDGLNLFTRHFVANPSVSDSGNPAGGTVGFLNGISSLCEKFSPSRVIVVWEGGGSTRKRQIYTDYKQKRRPEKLNRYYENDIPNTVENRNKQIKVLIEIIDNLPVNQIYVPDCEADDVIGYLCKYSFRNTRKLLVSSDKDFYQLLDKLTIIYSPTWKKIVTFKEVNEKFGISPENFCLAKSICGDPSDNIPGVKGAGFKVLAKRFPSLASSSSVTIQEINSLCKSEIESGKKIKLYKNIFDSDSLIKRNWKLIYLDTNSLSANQISKVNFSLENYSTKRNKINSTRILIREGIKSFNIDRLFLSLRCTR